MKMNLNITECEFGKLNDEWNLCALFMSNSFFFFFSSDFLLLLIDFLVVLQGICFIDLKHDKMRKIRKGSKKEN